MVDVLDFSLDSVNASNYGYELQGIGKPLKPREIETTVDIPKISGLIQSDKKIGKLLIPIYGKITGTSYSDLISKIAAFSSWVHGDEDKELIFSNQSDRYLNAQVIEEISVNKLSVLKARVEPIFTCNDPFAYDLTPTDSGDLPITVNGDNFIIANGGHDYAFPVITITFNQAQNHIYVQNNGIDNNRFDISKSFDIGDTLEVDCKNHTVKLNGSTSMAGFGDGGLNLANWIILAKDDNSMQVGTDDATIYIDINMTFNKVYFY